MYLPKGAIISGDAGHNCIPDTGVISLKSEDQCTKEIWTLVQKKLTELGFLAKDCTPWNDEFPTVGNSLSYRVKQANSISSALHLSIHFNSGGGRGVECWVSESGGRSEKFATKICESIAKLGYFNRGVKVGNLYIPKYTNMPCVLVECAFIDSKEDMIRYNAEALANAIVEAVISLGTP